jgi:hypothetical protein
MAATAGVAGSTQAMAEPLGECMVHFFHRFLIHEQ